MTRHTYSSKSGHEETCLYCDGAGILQDDKSSRKVRLCSGCNGHGVVFYDAINHRVVRYAATSKSRDIFQADLHV